MLGVAAGLSDQSEQGAGHVVRWDSSLHCNGLRCGQLPTNIRQLLALGYPAHELKWYRGGMQSWKTLGLTTVEVKAPPKPEAPRQERGRRGDPPVKRLSPGC